MLYRIDNYKFIRLLGQGNFGEVYMVMDLNTGQRHAMKVLKESEDEA